MWGGGVEVWKFTGCRDWSRKGEGRVGAETERGWDRKEAGGSKGVNYEGTNVESAEQLVAKPSCKSMHSIEEKIRNAEEKKGGKRRNTTGQEGRTERDTRKRKWINSQERERYCMNGNEKFKKMFILYDKPWHFSTLILLDRTYVIFWAMPLQLLNCLTVSFTSVWKTAA